MKTLLAVAAVALLSAGCRKGPKYEEPKQSEAAPAAPAEAPAAAPAPAQEPVRANPTYGGDLIRKAQGAAAAGNGQVQQEQKTDVPQQ